MNFNELFESDTSNLTREQKLFLTGAIGEKLAMFYVKEFEVGRKYDIVAFSESKFDMTRDIVANDGDHYDNIEVKVSTVIRKYNAFCMPQNQWYKLDEADRVFFINNPCSSTEKVSLYESTNKYIEVESFGRVGHNVRMYEVHKQKKLHTFRFPKLIDRMLELNTSYMKDLG